MRNLLLSITAILLLASCSKRIDCYECITERYNEMLDTNYTTENLMCDLPLENVKLYKRKYR